MTVLERMEQFSQEYSKEIESNGKTWRYFRLGRGSVVLFLTGGLRRAGMGFEFLERLSNKHTVIAPDYPPVMTIRVYLDAFDAILQKEQISSLALVGQSYGGMLAQAYLCHRPQWIERLILSSSGPANLSKGYIPVEYLCIGLARILPEKTLKRMLLGGLLKFVTLPEAERADWEAALKHVMQVEISRQDVVSHFAVALDMIRRGLVNPEVLHGWKGPIFVLQAANDPTQNKGDLLQYKKLFGRDVTLFDMGMMGHTALLFDPETYVNQLEGALV